MEKIEYLLDSQNKLKVCDQVSEVVREFCGAYTSDEKEINRYRLTIEECLLNWFDRGCDGRKLVVQYGKRKLREPFFELIYDGEAFNPYISEDIPSILTDKLLESLGLSPIYMYKNGLNILKFTIGDNGINSFKQLGITFALAAIVGFMGLMFMPETVMSVINNEIITPVYDTFMNVLNCIAGPMIFLSVAWGIYGIGDVATLNKIGKKIFLIFTRTNIIVAVLSLVTIYFLDVSYSVGSIKFENFTDILQTILQIIPSNIVEPFQQGNTLQIIFLATATGIALIYLGQKADPIAKAVESINHLTHFFMKAISKIVPYFVFVVVVSLMWSNSLDIITSTWKFVLVLLIAIIVLIVIFYAYAAIKFKTSFVKIFKKCMPSGIISLSTASSAAAFNSSNDICNNKLGINSSLTGFGIPLGMVMCKPINIVNMMIIMFFFMGYYNIELSLGTLVLGILSAIILSIATPPIPGGAAIAYTLFLAQMGIPTEALAVILAIDMVTDFIITAGETMCLLPNLILVADRVGLLHKEILRDEE
ncbi:MAG: dicarboxylate/amino acid:cation symporter [Clostridia bacterium]|nr:dicarboxylate/amino acid:cation symporter [Clostridia bacterium]